MTNAAKSTWAVISGGDLIKEYKSKASALRYIAQWGGVLEELAPLTSQAGEKGAAWG